MTIADLSEDYRISFRTKERQDARIVVIERSKNNADALFLLQVLGLDSYVVPREYLPIGRP